MEAGVPEGVVNIVHGGGGEVGMGIVGHPDIDLVSFTGSTGVGKKISEVAAATLKRVSLELGGKNAQLVMPDANLSLALEGVLWGRSAPPASAAPATSRLILHEAIYDRFLSMLVDRTNALKVGTGWRTGWTSAPASTAASRRRSRATWRWGRTRGRSLWPAGSSQGEGLEKRLVLPPDDILRGPARFSAGQEEIFGPVLSVIRVKSAGGGDYRAERHPSTGSRRRSIPPT